ERVGASLVRVLLGAAEVGVAVEPCGEVARGREGCAGAVHGVRFGAPPGRLDCAAAVRRDDQVDAGLAEALPELPPGRRAAVPVVEVDRGDEGEDLRGSHGSGKYGCRICRFSKPRESVQVLRNTNLLRAPRGGIPRAWPIRISHVPGTGRARLGHDMCAHFETAAAAS